MENRLSTNTGETELYFAMGEIELLISYACRMGLSIKPAVIKSSLQAKKDFQGKGELSVAAETQFWIDYNQLVELVRPATLLSIQQTNPSPLWAASRPRLMKKVKRVPVFYGASVFVVIVITVMLQSFYMIGVDVLDKTVTLFAERNAIRLDIKKLPATDPQREGLKQQEARYDQEFDANRILLFQWNGLWQLGRRHDVEFSRYDEFIHRTQSDAILSSLERALGANVEEENRAAALNQQLIALNRDRALATSRNLFFRNQLQAEYMLNLLSGYVLPLLFGCLGAFTLVLRSLHSAFQSGTFTLKHRLDYNLRIVLGGVMGISSGLFFGEGAAHSSGQYSPMMMAFLIGYNVEILFSMMDNIADRLSIENKKPRGKQSPR